MNYLKFWNHKQWRVLSLKVPPVGWKFQFRRLKIPKVKKCPKKLNPPALYGSSNLCHFWYGVAINTSNWKHFNKIKSLLLYKAMENTTVKSQRIKVLVYATTNYNNLLIILTTSNFQVCLKLSFLTYLLLTYLLHSQYGELSCKISSHLHHTIILLPLSLTHYQRQNFVSYL